MRQISPLSTRGPGNLMNLGKGALGENSGFGWNFPHDYEIRETREILRCEGLRIAESIRKLHETKSKA